MLRRLVLSTHSRNIGGKLLLNTFFQEFSTGPVYQPPRGYDWKVIVDPTRSQEYPGLFFGRLFRIFDIHIYPGEKSLTTLLTG
jgi:hypothetical protein